MNKTTSGLGLAVLAAAAVALAQTQPQGTPTPGPPHLAPNSSAIGTQLLSGTVWAYKPGQSITLKTSDGQQYDMPLESGVRVDGSVVEGKLAAIMWTTDSAGRTKVMSITAAPGSAADIERSAPSVPAKPPVTIVPSAAATSPTARARPTRPPTRPTPTPPTP